MTRSLRRLLGSRLRLPLFAFAIAITVVITLGGASVAAAHDPLVVFLVRHAEKVDSSADPELSPEGQARALELGEVLRDSGIEHVHSSDFARTRKTAAPVASQLGLEVELYDPFQLGTLVEKLRATGGRHLVVGHSNTTPTAVELLGGEPGSEIDEATEYDRLYVVTIDPHDDASTVLLRYGD